jgi:hypothetical protein
MDSNKGGLADVLAPTRVALSRFFEVLSEPGWEFNWEKVREWNDPHFERPPDLLHRLIERYVPPRFRLRMSGMIVTGVIIALLYSWVYDADHPNPLLIFPFLVQAALMAIGAFLFIGQLVALMPWWYIYLVLLMIRPAMWVSGIKPEGISWRDLRSYWRVVGVPTEHGQAIRRFRAFRARNDSELGFTCEVLPETLELKKHWARLKSFLRSLQARGLRLFARGDVSL